MPQHIPLEIQAIIIDHFHNDPETLRQCSLVSKSWAARAQKHLFNKIYFWGRPGLKLKLWEKTFPDPSNSPACLTKLLSIEYRTATAKENVGFIGSFTNVTHLEVDVDDRSYKPGSNVLHNLLPAVTSLCLYFGTVELSQLFALVGSFPTIKDLVIEGPEIVNDGHDFLPSTLPEFTGTLVLSCRLGDITRPLLRLPPKSLSFRRIVWKIDSPRDEDKVQHMENLIEKCSGTLEYIDFTGSMNDPPKTPLDLSKATELKGVAFRLIPAHMKWFTESLKTIPSEKKGLEQLLICFVGRWDDPNLQEVGGEGNQQCKDFDNALVRLLEPGGVRTGAVRCILDEWEAERHMRILFPEMVKRGKMEPVYLGLPSCAWPSVMEERHVRLRRYNEFWEWSGKTVGDGRVF